MRLAAFIPVVCSLVALVLSFLCLFAGSTKGFMEDYALVTLNTSRIGQNVLNTTASSTTTTSTNPVTNFLHNITATIEGDINADLNSLAKQLGLHDFYSAHILASCKGFYSPADLPNATLPITAIHKNVTACTNKTAMYTFDPSTTLQRELNASSHSNINLTELHWPSAVDDGLAALKLAQRATFVLYCLGIALTGLALGAALAALFLHGRLCGCANVLLHWLAFLAIGVASAVATVVAVKATEVVNRHGGEVGIAATKGGKFLALTWVAAALMFVTGIVACAECVVGRKRGARKGYADRPRY